MKKIFSILLIVGSISNALAKKHCADKGKVYASCTNNENGTYGFGCFKEGSSGAIIVTKGATEQNTQLKN